MSVPSRLAVLAIAALGAINLVRGSIHLFAPDGGLTAIAGLDLSDGRELVLFFIGAVGVGQIALGAIDLLIAWRHRAMVLPLLLVHMGELTLGLLLFFHLRPLPVAVPGQYGAIVSFLILAAVITREFWLGRADGAR